MMALTMITTMMKRMMSLRRTTLMMTVIMTLMLTLVRIKMVTTAIMRTTTWRRTTMMMTAGGCGQPHSSVTAPLLFLPLGKLSSSISRQYISKLSSSISRQYISKLSSSISNCAILCSKCICARSPVQCTRIKKLSGSAKYGTDILQHLPVECCTAVIIWKPAYSRRYATWRTSTK